MERSEAAKLALVELADAMPGGQAAGRRFLVAVGCADPGPRTRLRPLAGVSADLMRMVRLFEERLGFVVVQLGAAGQLNLDLSAHQLESALERFVRQHAPGAADDVVFYFSGHGINHGAVHYLCTRGFDDQHPSTGLETRRLAAMLPVNARRLWIMLDVCRAGDAASALCEAVSRDRARYQGSVWFLAACGQTAAQDQAFSQAFVSEAGACVARGGCQSQAELVRAIQRRLGGERAAQRLVATFYGSERFDFLGEALSGSRLRRFMQPFAPTLVMLGLSSFKTWLVPPVRASAAGGATPRLVVQAPVAARVRFPWWGTAAVLLSVGLLLAAALRRHAAQRELARTARHQVVPTSDTRVHFAGGSSAISTGLEAARQVYAECVAQGACSMPFHDSPFADEAESVAPVKVKPFSLSVLEVSNLQFVTWLNARASGLRVASATAESLQVVDPSARVLAVIAPSAAHPATGSVALYRASAGFKVAQGREQEPVASVTFHGAQAYCLDHGGRLPSEPEWALAARGLLGRRFAWGETAPESCADAGFARALGLPCYQGAARPLAVGTALRDRTPEGVHDLSGNVSEWTSSVLAASATPRFRAGCSKERQRASACRMVRGGSFWDSALYLRGAARSALDVDSYFHALGFRCAFVEAAP